MAAAVEELRKLTATVEEARLPSASVPLDEIWIRVRSVEAYTYHSQWIAESPEKYQAATRRECPVDRRN